MGQSGIENFTIKIENDGNGNPIYIGYAARGSSTADAVWQIRKVTYDVGNNPTDVQWADKTDQFVKVWNDRVTYTYS